MSDNSSISVKEIEEKLLFIFSNVNEWLKFAEVKNAGLVAFSVAGISGIIAFIALFQNISNIWKAMFFFPVFCLLLSCSISLLSFYPRINRLGILNSELKNPLDSDNLLFFGNLAKYDIDSLLDVIAEKYFSANEFNKSQRLTDISDQIIVNARITLAKFKLFKVAVFFSFLSIVLLILLSIALGVTRILNYF